MNLVEFVFIFDWFYATKVPMPPKRFTMALYNSENEWTHKRVIKSNVSIVHRASLMVLFWDSPRWSNKDLCGKGGESPIKSKENEVDFEFQKENFEFQKENFEFQKVNFEFHPFTYLLSVHLRWNFGRMNKEWERKRKGKKQRKKR